MKFELDIKENFNSKSGTTLMMTHIGEQVVYVMNTEWQGYIPWVRVKLYAYINRICISHPHSFATCHGVIEMYDIVLIDV